MNQLTAVDPTAGQAGGPHEFDFPARVGYGVEGADVVLGHHLEDRLGQHPEPVRHAGGHQVPGPAAPKVVATTDQDLSADNAQHLIALVHMHRSDIPARRRPPITMRRRRPWSRPARTSKPAAPAGGAANAVDVMLGRVRCPA
jgi:hypothetical protein